MRDRFRQESDLETKKKNQQNHGKEKDNPMKILKLVRVEVIPIGSKTRGVVFVPSWTNREIKWNKKMQKHTIPMYGHLLYNQGVIVGW